MAKRILRERNVDHVFIGEKSLFEKTLCLEIKGWMPENLWQRVLSLEASGIWQWWSKAIGSSTEQFSATEFNRTSKLVVEKPTMNGNAGIIFYLCGIFLGVSFCCL